MGGFGSGVWERTGTKRTVENCLHLNITDFISTGNLVPGKSGVAIWSSVGLSRFRHKASFTVSSDQPGTLTLNLAFTLTGFGDVQQHIPIQFLRMTDGRVYPRFVCPLNADGQTCGRSVRKLYTKQCFFGCRMCLGLVYHSSQHAHKEERLIRKLRQLP